jgi:hypothetical protein
MKLTHLFRRHRVPPTQPPQSHPSPSTATRPGGGHELRGHRSSVSNLATVPTAERTLLFSGDTSGSVLLWDGRTGEHLAGPVAVDGESVTGLAAVDLGADGWVLACAGVEGVTLWDPLRFGQRGFRPRRLLDSGVKEMAAIPGEPPLIVASNNTAVTVIDPANGMVVLDLPEPPRPPGHIGQQVYQLAGVRFSEQTAGFVAARYGDRLDFWELADQVWRERHYPPGTLGPGVLAAFDTQLAIAADRGRQVWDLSTGDRSAPADEETPFAVLAPVPLDGRTVVAGAFRKIDQCGVQLWDPHDPTTLSQVFNRHGSAHGDPRKGRARIEAVVGFTCPDGQTRVASGGNDDCVLVSAPLTEHDLMPGHTVPTPE